MNAYVNMHCKWLKLKERYSIQDNEMVHCWIMLILDTEIWFDDVLPYID